MQSDQAAASRGQSVLASISRDIVKVHAKFYGRGPTRAKTVWRDNVVVVILEEIFTRAESTLVGAGHFNQVRASRQAFQDEVDPMFRELVEAATGQPVRSFLSQVTADGVAAEVFVLADGSTPAAAAADPA